MRLLASVLLPSLAGSSPAVAQPFGIPYVVELHDAGADGGVGDCAAAEVKGAGERVMNLTGANGVKYVCCLPPLEVVDAASRHRRQLETMRIAQRNRATKRRTSDAQCYMYDELAGYVYLGGCAEACKGYATLPRAQTRCNAMGSKCSGVTRNNGKYELRTERNPGKSPNKEKSWLKRFCTAAEDEVKSSAAATAAVLERSSGHPADSGLNWSGNIAGLEKLRTHTKGPAPKGCFWLRAGYWTYQLCPFLNVSQFHLDGNSDEIGASFSLGTYAGKTLAVSPAGLSAAAMMLAPATFTQEYGSSSGDDDGDVASGAKIGDGRRSTVVYTCEPHHRFIKATESPKHVYNFEFGTPLACANRSTHAGKIGGILAPLYKQCIHKSEGWWTFEICHGRRVRQYHKEKDSVKEFLVGTFDDVANLALSKAGTVVQRADVVKGAHGPISAPAVSMKYTSGSLCDLGDGVTGPRSVTVRYWCPSAVSGAHAGAVAKMGAVASVGAITNVVEEETCQYTIAVASQLVCKHPDIAEIVAVDITPSAIQCVARSQLPVDADSEGEVEAATAGADACDPSDDASGTCAAPVDDVEVEAAAE